MADVPVSLRARVQRLASERARKVERLRRMEWEFDRNLNASHVEALALLRDEITELERRMILAHNRAQALAEIGGDDLESRTVVIPAKRSMPMQRIGEK
jgi:hypothetical protein